MKMQILGQKKFKDNWVDCHSIKSEEQMLACIKTAQEEEANSFKQLYEKILSMRL